MKAHLSQTTTHSKCPRIYIFHAVWYRHLRQRATFYKYLLPYTCHTGRYLHLRQLLIFLPDGKGFLRIRIQLFFPCRITFLTLLPVRLRLPVVPPKARFPARSPPAPLRAHFPLCRPYPPYRLCHRPARPQRPLCLPRHTPLGLDYSFPSHYLSRYAATLRLARSCSPSTASFLYRSS